MEVQIRNKMSKDAEERYRPPSLLDMEEASPARRVVLVVNELLRLREDVCVMDVGA